MKHALLVLAAGCTAPAGTATRIDVEQNELGVVALQIEDVDTGGDRTYELQGLDAGDRALVSVRLHVGEIADLATFRPRDTSTHGSELVITTPGRDPMRLVSSETRYWMVPASEDATWRRFRALSAVRTALEKASIRSVAPDDAAPPADTRYDDYPRWQDPPYTYNCPPDFLQSVVTQTRDTYVQQCCWTSNYPYGWYYTPYTLFVVPSNQNIVMRMGPSTPCTNPDGSWCTGSGCFFGPNGFSKPVYQAAIGAAAINTTYDEGIACAQSAYGVTFPPQVGSLSNGTCGVSAQDAAFYY